MSDDIIAQLRTVFFEEAFEGLGVMEAALMDLDTAPDDPDILNSIFRAAHSIKGGAGSFGFENISRFTHGMETLLDEMREGRRSVEPALVDILLRSTDQLRALVEAASEGGEVDAEATRALTEELERILAAEGPPPSEGPSEPSAAEPASSGHLVRFVPHLDLMNTGNDPVLIFRELGELGELSVELDASRLPALESLDPEQLFLQWTLRLEGEADLDSVKEVFDWVESDCDLEFAPLGGPEPVGTEAEEQAPAPVAAEVAEPGPAPPPSAPSPVVEASPPKAPTSKAPTAPVAATAVNPPAKAGGPPPSIRVGIDKVDALMDIVGELVITQSMLCQIEKEFDMSRLEKLSDGLGELTRNTRELQESVMRLRMVPVSFLFSRFPRLVRDVRSSLGKEVELEMLGEATEVDKTVSEQLTDPLVHLVRNALDHGLETPEGRREAGKDEVGMLRLSARHEGGSVIIDVEDDGRGLNPDKILAKARERGMVGADERPSDERIFDFIFAPGFSTAAEVTSLSGRGVGLDVVCRNIRSLGGTIEIKSTLGKGTCFSIRLPLTLSILDAQLVRLVEQVFIIPLLSIVESVQVRPELVSTVAGGREIYRLRDQYIPIIRASEMLGVKRPESSSEPRLLVVVEAAGGRAGVLVDELLDQQQVVIKSLESNFKPVPGISGATILGDGKVAFIIDVAGFVRLAAQRVAGLNEALEERLHD